MAKERVDQYANLLVDVVTQSAANTLTFEEINIGLNIFDKVGIVINRLEYNIGTSAVALMTATTDVINAGLTTSNAITTLASNQTEVVDGVNWARFDMGAAASGQLYAMPLIRDFSTMPGGGLLVPPKPLYFAADSTGLASATNVTFRMTFIIKTLTDAEYLELLETRRAFG